MFERGIEKVARNQESGIALISVIAVLMALILIATPFALSMRGQYETAVYDSASIKATLLAESAVVFAKGHLRGSCQPHDDTPEYDDLEEFEVELDELRDLLLEDDKQGSKSLLSVQVWDEQARISVNSASPDLLGNIFGLRTSLSTELGAEDIEIAVEDASLFDPDGGYVYINGEMIGYGSIGGAGLAGCERGANPDGFVYGDARSHSAGSSVIDGRIIRLIEGRLSASGRTYAPYRALSEMKRLCEIGELFFHPAELATVEPFLTVHSMRPDEKSWVNSQRVYGFLDPEDGLSTILIPNARYYASGTVVKLTDGSFTWTTIVGRYAGGGSLVQTTGSGNTEEIRGERITLLGEVDTGDFEIEHLMVFAESRHPINVNTASREVLLALLTGLKVGRGQEEQITRTEADLLIDRFQAEPLTGRQDLLERVLFPMEEAGECSSEDLSAVYRNALNSNDRELGVRTGPLCFSSFDVYSVEGTCIRTNAAGLELARRSIREVVHIAAKGEAILELTTQEQFEDQIIPSRACRWMITTPYNVARFEPRNNPPSRYFMNRVRKVFPSRELTGEEGEDEGDVRLGAVRISPPGGRPRTRVEHFDQEEDPDGYKTDRGAFRMPVEVGPEAVRSLALSFWYKPEDLAGQATLFDYGRGLKEEDRISLIYRPDEGNLVLEVADPALPDPQSSVDEISHVTYPLTLQDRTWYHMHSAVRGSKPSDLTLIVDGNPLPAKAGFITRLTSSIGADDGSLAVHDAESFPDVGVLRIGGRELAPYTSKSGSSFTLGSSHPFERIRGARGTQAVTHEEGESVELAGYSNPTTSDIPIGGGSLGSALGPFRVARLNSDDKIPPGILYWCGIDANATEIPITGLPGETDFLDGFQDSGYALIIPPEFNYERKNADGQTIYRVRFGAPELIFYGSIQGNKLTNVQRGLETEWIKTSSNKAVADLIVPRMHLNFRPKMSGETASEPTLIVPISIEATGVTINHTSGNYLVPSEGGQGTGITERIQLDEEWICYDSIESPQGQGDAYFLRHAAQIHRQIASAFNTPNVTDMIGGDDVCDVAGNQYQVTSDEIFNTFEFRGVDGSELLDDHNGGDEIIPCFRVRGNGVGRNDYVTVVTPRGQKEAYRVKQAHRGRDFVQRGGTRRNNFVALETDVTTRVFSTIQQLLNPGTGGTNPRTERSIYKMRPQELTRLLKFPSGELPLLRQGQIAVGSRRDGGEVAFGYVDEIEMFAPQRGAYVINIPTQQNLTTAFIDETEDEITVYRANAVSADDGSLRPDDYINSGQGFSALGVPVDPNYFFPPNSEDGGLFRIGEELIAYRDFEENGGADPPEIIFKDCIRGFLGTEKTSHSRFETLVPLMHIPVAVIDAFVTGESSEIAVTDSRGFNTEGCLAIVNGASGERGELLHYTNRSRTLFSMPKGGDAEFGEGGGLFRARYGTFAQGMSTGDVVLQMPIRYWDRYRELSDDPELSFFQASATIPSAFFTQITWDEVILKPFLDVRMLVRVDGRAKWDDEPLGAKNGLFLFEDPITQDRVNRIDMQGDSIEIRLYFMYEQGAFNNQFSSDSWKETPWLQQLQLHYVAPTFTLWREEE